MALKKGYKGYKAYQYLEKGKDYRAFELAEEVNRVEEFLVPLNESEESRVARLAEELIFISLHDHPNVFPKDPKEFIEYASEGRAVTAYEGLAHSYLDCVFDNMFDGICTIISKRGWKWDDVIFDIGMRLSDILHQDFIIKCDSVDDIYRAHKEGKIAFALAVEGAAPIENEVDRVDILQGLGVRLMGITYSESNALGSGLKEDRDGGLTKFGRQVVERMNKVGMAIDVSHVGDLTAKDVVEASTKPIFITHIGAKALHNIKRLADDDLMKMCADKGGVIGIEAAPHTTITKNHPQHSIDSFMEHFEYIANLVGVDHVGFGSDTLYGDHVALHKVYAAHLSTKGTQGDYEPVEYVKGVENPSEASKNILRWLVKRNYSDQDIEKVLSGNSLRVLKDVWQ